MIQLGRLDHVALRVADVAEASERWVLQFGLTERSRDAARATLSCDDEPLAIELIAGSEPGFDHVGWELARDCSVEQALADFDAAGVEAKSVDDHIELQDVEGNALHLLPYREPPSRFVAHVRSATGMRPGRPRKLGHVNFLTGCLQEQTRFYQDVLGMRLTDSLGDDASWLHIGPEHHVMALVNKGYAHLHHMAFDVVDIGQMRDALDHVARHGRWLGWGPTRHGVGGNVASYVRIVEEECFVELYCDMEVLQPDHEPRRYEDNRFSSNTWGPLPPRSYFRFDEAAIASERESLETQGVPLA
jgi:catechol 2,3-dioxygenase-like lactoylglutathione lyase family enzyme